MGQEKVAIDTVAGNTPKATLLKKKGCDKKWEMFGRLCGI